MIIYNKYVDNQDYTWYDSSNVLFSKCYDNPNSSNKTLKVVFKNSRTYVYKDVDVNDYLTFKTATSNGQAFNKCIIKKYQGVRITDTQADKLEQLKESFIKETEESSEKQVKDLIYKVDFDEKTNEFILKMGGQIVYHGIEGKVSLFSLFKSMNISYALDVVDEVNYDSDEEKDEIILED